MQLSEVFTQAILLPINERQKFIHDSCNGDQIIINEVNGLIESESSQQCELAANWTRFINEKIVESSVCKPDFVGQVVG
ncbi:MAG: hypothetical protein HAW66_07715, partial [Shewanella sp.]|nr:hypothetical protein [Shewanella sp.]